MRIGSRDTEPAHAGDARTIVSRPRHVGAWYGQRQVSPRDQGIGCLVDVGLVEWRRDAGRARS